MKIPVIALSLCMACCAVSAAPAPDKMPVIGEWSGRGETVGNTFTACATLSPYMDNLYLHLDYSVHYDKAGLPALKTETFYYFLDGGKDEGVSLDNQSNVFQLNSIYAERRMSTQGLKNGKAIAQTEWRLSEDGKTLSYVRFGQMPSGEMKEISEVAMTRVPDGGHCGKTDHL